MTLTQAGYALDNAIAEKLFGWTVRWVTAREWGEPESSGGFWAKDEPRRWQDDTTWTPVPRYSTEIAAAWLVVEAMHCKEFGCEIWCPNSDGLRPHVNFYPDAFYEYEVAADTVPEAICRAALAALEAD